MLIIIRKIIQILMLISLQYFSLTSCIAQNVTTASNTIQQNTIIFIPGYYGTALKRDATNKRTWLTAWELILGNNTLALDEIGLEIPGAEPYSPDGILKQINLIPGLFSIDIYGDAIDKLNTLSGFKVIQFTYDWRRNNMLAIKKLGELVDQLKKTNNNGKIIIVAHSMGGLITSYYLRYGIQPLKSAQENWAGAKKIDKVVMAGVPFRGVVSVFRNMQIGSQFGLNKTLLKSHAIASFVSSYQTLFLDPDKVLNNQLEPYSGVHDAQTWKQHHWGLMNNDSDASEEAMKQRYQFLQKSLNESRHFLNLINAPDEIDTFRKDTFRKETFSTPLFYIQSNSRKTLGKMIVYQNQQTFRLIYEDEELERLFQHQKISLFVSGDGTVSTVSAQLPATYQATADQLTIKIIDAEHSKLYSDTRIMKQVIDFIK